MRDISRKERTDLRNRKKLNHNIDIMNRQIRVMNMDPSVVDTQRIKIQPKLDEAFE